MKSTQRVGMPLSSLRLLRSLDLHSNWNAPLTMCSSTFSILQKHSSSEKFPSSSPVLTSPLPFQVFTHLHSHRLIFPAPAPRCCGESEK